MCNIWAAEAYDVCNAVLGVSGVGGGTWLATNATIGAPLATMCSGVTLPLSEWLRKPPKDLGPKFRVWGLGFRARTSGITVRDRPFGFFSKKKPGGSGFF